MNHDIGPGRKTVWALCAAVLVAFSLAGCGGTIEETIDKVVPKREPKYKSSKSLPPLEVPPDLSSGAVNDAMRVPQGSATYSDYTNRSQDSSLQQAGVLPELTDVRVERSGDKRWLVVNAAPAQVWPKVRSFWLEQGFLVEMEDPSIGIMETDWAEQRTDFKKGLIEGFLSKLSNALYGAATRDKFRTRLERGAQAGSTEVFVSHRGAEEVSTGKVSKVVDATGTAGESRVWQPRPADPELEAEMLNRLMVYFGVQEQRAGQMIASTRDRRDRARLVRGPDGAGSLALDEDFSRAWRRTGLALDRVGFTVEDRDRSRGLYYVRYVDPEASQKEEKGFFSKLKFWGSDDNKRDDAYLISLIGGRDGDATTQVVVLNKKGERDATETADRILTLLHEQLR